MKKILIIFLLSNTIITHSQNSEVVSDEYGIEISCKWTVEKEKNGKKHYFMIVSAKNTNDYDLYYLKDDDNSGLDFAITPGFYKITIQNAKGAIGVKPFVSAIGRETDMRVNGKTVWVLEAGKTYKNDKRFKLSSEKTPFLNGEYYIDVSKIDKYY